MSRSTLDIYLGRVARSLAPPPLSSPTSITRTHARILCFSFSHARAPTRSSPPSLFLALVRAHVQGRSARVHTLIRPFVYTSFHIICFARQIYLSCNVPWRVESLPRKYLFPTELVHLAYVSCLHTYRGMRTRESALARVRESKREREIG
jgi:hypothetical protein